MKSIFDQERPLDPAAVEASHLKRGFSKRFPVHVGIAVKTEIDSFARKYAEENDLTIAQVYRMLLKLGMQEVQHRIRRLRGE